jgi:hypothetical protein
VIEPWEYRVPEEREPHELPHMLEQAASDMSTDFHIWRSKSRAVFDTHEMPAPKEWLDLIRSLEKLDAVLAEIDARDGA